MAIAHAVRRDSPRKPALCSSRARSSRHARPRSRSRDGRLASRGPTIFVGATKIGTDARPTAVGVESACGPLTGHNQPTNNPQPRAAAKSLVRIYRPYPRPHKTRQICVPIIGQQMWAKKNARGREAARAFNPTLYAYSSSTSSGSEITIKPRAAAASTTSTNDARTCFHISSIKSVE